MEENTDMADLSRPAPTKHLFWLLAVVATVAMVAAGCTGGGDDAADGNAAVPDDQAAAGRERDNILTVHSRTRDSELFELFEKETGVKVRARWGNFEDLADQIIEDGADSPADVYYAPLSDALGLLSAAGRLATLTDEQLDRVPQAYRSPEGTWVGTSGRAHVVVYNTDQVSEDDLPDSILGFTDPAWRGRIGWDPANRSLQGVITALRQLKGEDETRAWLEGVHANTPAVFDGPRPIIKAVAAGKIIEVGFANHYYLDELQSEGDATNVAAKFYGGDPGGLLQVAGVGIIKGTDNEAAANAFVDFLLSRPTQQYFAKVNLEIPLVEGIDPPTGTPTADELTVSNLDVRQLEDLQSTRELLTETGIIM
jgi:iron(III) transport system substrate-binding protein